LKSQISDSKTPLTLSLSPEYRGGGTRRRTLARHSSAPQTQVAGAKLAIELEVRAVRPALGEHLVLAVRREPAQAEQAVAAGGQRQGGLLRPGGEAHLQPRRPAPPYHALIVRPVGVGNGHGGRADQFRQPF